MGSPGEETGVCPPETVQDKETCVVLWVFVGGFPGQRRGVGVGLSGEICRGELVDGRGGQELQKWHKSTKDRGSSWLGRKLMPGSGTRAERQVVAKKTLMRRAGFYLI